jgi:uncharacterized membrane protein YfcA
MNTKYIFYIVAGAAGGVLAGMGMGGGTLTIPLLVMLLDVDQLTAQIVNLIAFLPAGALALGMHLKNKLVNAKVILPVLIPALVTTIATAIPAADMEAELLRKMFGGFLIVIAAVSLLINAKAQLAQKAKG